MRKTLRVINTFFVYLFYLPYIIIYVSVNNDIRCLVDKDLYSSHSKKTYRLFWLVFYLRYDCYFKTMFFHRTKTCKLSRLLYHDNVHDFYIPYDVSLGENIHYSHPYGTILNAKSIGDNFHFKHLTTIGNKDNDENKRPVILDNVRLGANVTIIGDVVIGNNVVVGAGAIITKSIPDNSVIVGQPFRNLVTTVQRNFQGKITGVD